MKNRVYAGSDCAQQKKTALPRTARSDEWILAPLVPSDAGTWSAADSSGVTTDSMT
jgi:hypothetical protein